MKLQMKLELVAAVSKYLMFFSCELFSLVCAYSTGMGGSLLVCFLPERKLNSKLFCDICSEQPLRLSKAI